MSINNQIKTGILTLFILFTNSYSAKSQRMADFREAHRESVHDPYLAPGFTREVSAGYRQITNLYFTQQVNVNADGENIVGDAANEPSIAINPLNPDNMIIGWRQFDDVHSDFRQAGYAYTFDGGHTWTFPGVIEPGVFRSDPVLGFDNNGTFYYNSLTADQYNNFSCQVFRSTNGGFTWDDGVFAQGGDKQWMTIDRTGSMGEGNIYASWTSYYSACFPGFFTRSTDGGDSYENCVSIDGNPHWGTMAVGPDGILYSAGIDDGGEFVIAKSLTAKDPDATVTWQFHTNVEMGGHTQFQTGPNPQGLLGQVWVAADTSTGNTRGNVYILCSVKPDNSNDPCDVMFIRSTDGGETWSDPVRINDDPMNNSAWQWFGTMSVAPNGRIDVVWLDTRDNPGTYLSSLYYSYSINGGETWSPNQKISDAFDPHVGWPQQQKMGDYYHMISLINGAHLAWANTLNGEQDVYYTHIYSPFDAVVENGAFSPDKLTNYPNPFLSKTTIRYSLAKKSKVKITVSDPLGHEEVVLVNSEKNAGNYLVTWNATRFQRGIYFCTMRTETCERTVKLLHY